MLLIIVVGANILLGSDDNDEASPQEQNNIENNNGVGTEAEEEDETTDAEEETPEEETDDPTDTETEDPSETETNEQPSDETDKETDTDSTVDIEEGTSTEVEESDDPNVAGTIVNQHWEPIGTEQTGEHTKNFSSDSQDWKEMQMAIASALGTSTDGLTYWCVENGGADQVIGTVTAKSNVNEPYRVYIEWVDGQGWKPFKVETLIENDKKNSCGG